jgi:hypothetical protein
VIADAFYFTDIDGNRTDYWFAVEKDGAYRAGWSESDGRRFEMGRAPTLFELGVMAETWAEPMN